MQADTVPVGQARSRLTEILATIQRQPVVITKDGVPAAVVLAPADYAALTATVDLMRNPEAQARLREHEERSAAGSIDWVAQAEAERELIG